jgi:hypothetical protein
MKHRFGSDLRLTHPIILGLLAGLGFTIFLVISGITWGFDPGELLIAAGAGASGTGVGVYLSWKLTTRIRRGR